MLYIFGGLPGTGKSTLAQYLAHVQQAVHLRIDTIEQSLCEVGCLINGPEGYVVAYRLAADNLRLGLRVVADSVNPIEVTRAAWREVATRVGVPFVEIEVICSNAAEHRARIETRVTDIAGLRLPTWDDVVHRPYDPWDDAHLVIDTAGQACSKRARPLGKRAGVWNCCPSQLSRLPLSDISQNGCSISNKRTERKSLLPYVWGFTCDEKHLSYRLDGASVFGLKESSVRTG